MKRTILIVDDEFGLAELIAELLVEQGYEATIAINGRAGLQSLERQRADLILLDVMMPLMTGPEMARALRGDPNLAGLPIVMMTSLAAALPTDQPPLYDAFLHKPFTPEQMFRIIDRLLAPRP